MSGLEQKERFHGGEQLALKQGEQYFATALPSLRRLHQNGQQQVEMRITLGASSYG